MLLSEIDQFLEQSGMTPTAFGKAAVGDPNFVRDLRHGREPRSRVVARAKDFIAAHSVAAEASS